MTTNKLSNLSLEEIQSKKNKLQNIVIGLGTVMFLACGALIYLAFHNKNYGLIVVAFACLISMLPSIIVISQYNKEIKARSTTPN